MPASRSFAASSGVRASWLGTMTGTSMAVFYASGAVFALLGGLLLVHGLWRLLSGRMADEELIAVQESEDLAQVRDLHPGQPAKA